MSFPKQTENINAWDKLNELLQDNPKVSAHAGDHTQLMSYAFNNVLQKHTSAKQAALVHLVREQQDSRVHPLISSDSTSIAKLSDTIKSLHEHFQYLLTHKEQISTAIRGFEPNEVIRASPAAQQHFSLFLKALVHTWAPNSEKRLNAVDLIDEWAQIDVNDLLLKEELRCTESACVTLKEAFQVFQNALRQLEEYQPQQELQA